MGGTAVEKSKGTKKRWRIGGMRNRSKTKDLDAEDSSHTASTVTSPESSYSNGDVDSNGSSNEEPHVSNDNHNANHMIVSDLPPAMSEVEDSDDEDLYLESNHNMKDIGTCSTFSKPPKPLRDDSEDERQTSNCPSITTNETSSVDREGHESGCENYNSDSSFDEEMNRHKYERRNSPHFSKELAKISEDSDELLFAPAIGTPKETTAGDTSQQNVDAETKRVDPIVPSQPTDEEKEEDIDIDIPTHKELSKTLCKIVATEHYSGRECMVALEKLSKWAHTQESNLLKHFLTYGGVVKVVDYMDEMIENCDDKEFLMEAIHKSADVLCNVCFVGKHGINEDIAVVNATVVVKYGGIETLLLASDVFNRSDMKNEPMALKAVEGVWNAIMNVYCNAEAAVTKAISMLVLDASIETMSAVGDVDSPIASETLANVFNSLYRITYHDFVSKDDFHRKDLLTHVLNVFKRDVNHCEGDEELLEEAISFLYGCHEKALFNKGSDYESVLPLCVMGLREFAQENENIREWASKLLDGACSNIENKETIMMAEGAIEAIAPFLTFEEVDATDKEFMRNLIRKIVSPV